MGSYVKLIWLVVISFLLLGVSGVWFYKEINPEWKQCQRAEIQEKIHKVKGSYTEGEKRREQLRRKRKATRSEQWRER